MQLSKKSADKISNKEDPDKMFYTGLVVAYDEILKVLKTGNMEI